MYELLLAYPAVGIELVGIVAGVDDRDRNNRLFTVVVRPVSNSCRHCEHIALSEAIDSLVLVSLALSSAFLHPPTSTLERLERFWATRHHCSKNSPTYSQTLAQ